MGYLGCATRTNKLLYALFAGLVLLGAVLVAVGGSKLGPCRRQLDACKLATKTARPPPESVCFQRFRDCGRGHIITGAVGVLGFVAAVGLLCGMCCCAPAPKMDPAAAGIQMNQPGYPVGHPAGDPNAQQPYGQPYAAAAGGAGAAAPYGAAAAADPYNSSATYTPFQATQQHQQHQQQPYQAYPYQQQQQPYGQPYAPPAGGQAAYGAPVVQQPQQQQQPPG